MKRKSRAAAFFACVAVLASPLGVLNPTEALAQSTGTLDTAPSGRVKKAHAAKSKPRTLPPDRANTRDDGLPPGPPSFYSVSQLGDHLYSVRWELAAHPSAIRAPALRDGPEGQRVRGAQEHAPALRRTARGLRCAWLRAEGEELGYPIERTFYVESA